MNLKPIVALLFFCLPLGLLGQDEQGFIAKINNYHDVRPVEKLHLHTDKYAYTTGEHIWFKIYNVIGIHNLLSSWSSIAYVDLINPAGEQVQSIKIPLASGLGIGDLALVDSLVEGSYRLRAYSNWMRNDSSAYFFDQTIKISNGRGDNVISSSWQEDNRFIVQLQNIDKSPLNKIDVRYRLEKGDKVIKRGKLNTDEAGKLVFPFDKDSKGAKLALFFDNIGKTGIKKIYKLPTAEPSPNSIQFFPEGGSLLEGGLNGLAVKSLRPDGKGIKSSSYILNGQGDTVAVLETNHLGMGASLLFVDKLSSLKVHTIFADGTIVDSQLPAASNSGYNMVVNNASASRLFAQVNITADKLDGKDIYLLVQYMGRSYYISKQKASKNELTFMVPKQELPTGILTLSILDAELRPLMERPIFIHQPGQQLVLTGQTDATSYGTRKKVTVSFQTGDSSDQVRHAALSASVLAVDRIRDSTSLMPNIFSNLFFNADIKGYIEEPGYYFDQEVKVKDIDYLLQTQAWRKIDLNSALDTSAVQFEVEKGITIKGQARKLGRKAPVPEGKITLISMLNVMDQLDTITNEKGEFEFDKLFFPDSVKFLVTAKDNKGKNNIDIIVPKYEEAAVGLNKNEAEELFHVNQLMTTELIDAQKYFSGLEAQGLMEKTIAIESITVTARAPRKEASKNSSNMNGPGNADQIISAEDLETCATLEMCLAGRLMGVTFIGGIPHTTRGGGAMQVILDGMYIEADQLSMINPSDVQSVEVLRNSNYTAIYGMHGGNGLIIITSKTGADIRRNYTPKGILSIQPKGLHINKLFYKPVYEVDSDKQLKQDLRSTIAWEPNILTDKEGKGSFDFYTADRVGRYMIIIEGLNFEGKLGRKILTIEVK